MDFENLINKTFQENELYELLLFELEENLEQYSSQLLHFYFESMDNGRVKIMELASFKNRFEMDQRRRSLIEKRSWFEIDGRQESVLLMLCRLDRTGFISTVRKDSTHTENWKVAWSDEDLHRRPMTSDEIRQAFRELAGALEDPMDLQKLRPKKAM